MPGVQLRTGCGWNPDQRLASLAGRGDPAISFAVRMPCAPRGMSKPWPASIARVWRLPPGPLTCALPTRAAWTSTRAC